MRAPYLFGIVFAIHAMALSSLVLMGGCTSPSGSTSRAGMPNPTLPPKAPVHIPAAPVYEVVQTTPPKKPFRTMPPRKALPKAPANAPNYAASSVYVVKKGDMISKIAAAHGTGAAQVVLRWQWQLGIVVNPEAQKLQYQLENLEFFNFTLTETEMATLSNWR